VKYRGPSQVPRYVAVDPTMPCHTSVSALIIVMSDTICQQNLERKGHNNGRFKLDHSTYNVIADLPLGVARNLERIGLKEPA